MTLHIPPFISRFEEPSCWCRLEPRKRRANWKLIPEMSAACVIPAAFVHSHHILRPWMRLCPFPARFWEFSLPRAHRRWSERARCPPIITVASIIMGCYSHWWRQTSAHDWLLHNLKGNVGKGFVSVQIPGLTLGLTHDRGGKTSLLPLWDRKARRLNRIPPVGTWKTINRFHIILKLSKTPSFGWLFSFLSIFYYVVEDNAKTLTFNK